MLYSGSETGTAGKFLLSKMSAGHVCRRPSAAMKPLFALPPCLLFAPVMVLAIMGSNTTVLGPRVSLPSSNSTNSFWLHLSPEDSPLANVGSTGSLTQDADICVIGSGITGVGVVWHLVKDFQESLEDSAKMKVVLLEARQFCKGVFFSVIWNIPQSIYSGSGATGIYPTFLRRSIVCSNHKIQDETVAI